MEGLGAQQGPERPGPRRVAGQIRGYLRRMDAEGSPPLSNRGQVRSGEGGGTLGGSQGWNPGLSPGESLKLLPCLVCTSCLP